ncbi:MAG: hypothetical protein PUA60_06595 [Methanobacteriaceae archaeon]|nr:hypothetical protein [Methanobacteriaceae archaeon]
MNILFIESLLIKYIFKVIYPCLKEGNIISKPHDGTFKELCHLNWTKIGDKHYKEDKVTLKK